MLNAAFVWRESQGLGGKLCRGHVRVTSLFHGPNYWLENMERENFLSFIGLCTKYQDIQGDFNPLNVTEFILGSKTLFKPTEVHLKFEWRHKISKDCV